MRQMAWYTRPETPTTGGAESSGRSEGDAVAKATSPVAGSGASPHRSSWAHSRGRSRVWNLFQVDVYLILKGKHAAAPTSAVAPPANCDNSTAASSSEFGQQPGTSGSKLREEFVANVAADEYSSVGDLLALCHTKFALHCALPDMESFSLCEYSEYDTDVYLHVLNVDVPVVSVVQARQSKIHWRATNCRFVLMENGAVLSEGHNGFRSPTLTSAPPYLTLTDSTDIEIPSPNLSHPVLQASFPTAPLSSQSISLELNRKSTPPVISSTKPTGKSLFPTPRPTGPVLPPAPSPPLPPTAVIPSPAHLSTGYCIIQTTTMHFLSCGLASKGEVTLAKSLCSSELWFVEATFKKGKFGDIVLVSLQGNLKLWLRAPKNQHFPLCDRKVPGSLETFKAIADQSGGYELQYQKTNNIKL
ncbi:hypothetical protein Pelo_14914 [Pelomyxa schiedti]|nr:hypothetical protein Pelo_14914 [Pelomyxa schiedti]